MSAVLELSDTDAIEYGMVKFIADSISSKLSDDFPGSSIFFTVIFKGEINNIMTTSDFKP